MTIPLRTRSDLKRAGRAFAEEHAAILTRFVLTWTEDELRDEARIDAAITRIVESIDAIAASYLRQGIPPLWVAKFRSVALRTAGERMREVGFAAGIRLVRARALDAMPAPSNSVN